MSCLLVSCGNPKTGGQSIIIIINRGISRASQRYTHTSSVAGLWNEAFLNIVSMTEKGLVGQTRCGVVRRESRSITCKTKLRKR